MGNVSFSLGKSLILHLALGGLLVVSLEFHTPTKPQELVINTPIEAVVIDQSAVQQQMQRIEDKKKAEEKRKRDEINLKNAEKRKKQKLAEKKKADEAARKKKAKKLEEDRKRKESERKKAEEKTKKEKQKREKEARRKKQEQQEKAEQERILQEQMNAERAAQAKRRSKHVLSEKDKYKALIYQAIKNKLLTDDYMKGKSCKVNILMATTGFVTRVKVLGGDPGVCRAAENAVLKAGNLPVSPEADVYQQLRDITFIFNL